MASFFEDVFTTKAEDFDSSRLNCISKLVSDKDNAQLLTIPKEPKVRDNVFKMSFTSAVRSNSFLVAFYRTYWDIIQEDVVSMV